MKNIKNLSKWTLCENEQKFELCKFPQLQIMWWSQTSRPHHQRMALSPQPTPRLFLWIESSEDSFDPISYKEIKTSVI